jgi:catechol 2,3-dioxygenase-like lactoylglutathione lyase family enzyme
VAYRSWTHIALAVRRLRPAEEFYARLFGMTVAFREAEAPDGWRTLPRRHWLGLRPDRRN